MTPAPMSSYDRKLNEEVPGTSTIVREGEHGGGGYISKPVAPLEPVSSANTPFRYFIPKLQVLSYPKTYSQDQSPPFAGVTFRSSKRRVAGGIIRWGSPEPTERSRTTVD